MIKFRCRKCAQKVAMRPMYVGRLIKCPRCGQGNRVPTRTQRDLDEPIYASDVLEEVADDAGVNAPILESADDALPTLQPIESQLSPPRKSARRRPAEDDLPVLDLEDASDDGALAPAGASASSSSPKSSGDSASVLDDALYELELTDDDEDVPMLESATSLDDAFPPPQFSTPAQQAPSKRAQAYQAHPAAHAGGYAAPSAMSAAAALGGYRARPRTSYDAPADGFLGRISRSWQFAKISYGIIWDFKRLLVFPILSGLAAIAVLASFILPLFAAGTLEAWQQQLDQTGQPPIISYVVSFAFYFCSYFVIVFFNTALTACAMKVVAGEAPTIGYGMSIAFKRLPQIAMWALVSAVVGVILKIIENAHEKVGQIISAVLGTAWTVLTYFVVPVLCVEGVGPFAAIKQSVSTLKQTWGEATVGNFSMGMLSFLVALPVWIVGGLLIFMGMSNNAPVFMGIGIAVLVVGLILVSAASSAADVVFKALLYNYATGRALPANVDADLFPSAFAHKAGKE